MTATGDYPVSMLIGAFGVLALQRTKPKSPEEYEVPVSSGIIAEDSLIGMLIAPRVVAGVRESGSSPSRPPGARDARTDPDHGLQGQAPRGR